MIAFSFTADIFWSVCHAGADSVRHEIFTDIRWISTEYTHDRYVINTESFPSASGERRNDYLQVMSSYSCFLSPIPHDAVIPFALERFYAHPTVCTVSFALQPESDSEHIFRHSAQDVYTATRNTLSSRQAGASLDYYPWNGTGFLLSVQSAIYEDQEWFSGNMGNKREGEREEIKRFYGVGMAHYPLEDLRLSFMYTFADFEYFAYENDVERGNPFLDLKAVEEADTDGHTVSVGFEYILNRRWKFSGHYQFFECEQHSELFSPYYYQLPDSTVIYHDKRTQHTVRPHATVYLSGSTALNAGGQFAWNRQDREYSIDQVTEYEWDETRLEAGLSYDVNHHIGLRIGYEFSREDGDMLIRYPETESNYRTAYQTQHDEHTLSCGISGRF